MRRLPAEVVEAKDRDAEALKAWRTSAERIDEPTLRRVQALVAGRLSAAHPLWPAARRGDDAAAVRIAFDALEAGVEGPGLDIAMSALLTFALAGNAAAKLVLDHGAAMVAHGRVGARD